VIVTEGHREQHMKTGEKNLLGEGWLVRGKMEATP
jgi:hypothetical protein